MASRVTSRVTSGVASNVVNTVSSRVSALASPALRLAYWGQQEWWRNSCELLGRAVRRMVMGKETLEPSAVAMLRHRYRALLEQDLANVERGYYPASMLFQIPYAEYARVMPRLMGDLPRVVRRKKKGDFRDLPSAVEPTDYPAYYRRTFHWQSDGYLSRRSAELYDLGVELLFGGTADVMRRQTLPPIIEAARDSAGQPRILDVACGTGRALAQLVRALPQARYDAIDLSPWYLDKARQNAGQAEASFTVGNAEALPWPAETFDATFSVYLFHELPRATRRKVWAEMQRVTKPGGTIVIMDSMQAADSPKMAFFLERFNEDMHEPFYKDYQRDDLAQGLSEVGLDVRRVTDEFLSKMLVARRPHVH